MVYKSDLQTKEKKSTHTKQNWVLPPETYSNDREEHKKDEDKEYTNNKVEIEINESIARWC